MGGEQKKRGRSVCEEAEEERAGVREGMKKGRKDVAKQARHRFNLFFSHPKTIPWYFPPHPYNVSLKIEWH